LGKQLIRSGTSIGANLEEAQAGQSRADLISKNAIALKEARETHYWLRLFFEPTKVSNSSSFATSGLASGSLAFGNYIMQCPLDAPNTHKGS
jgi:four helix bundle protein